MKKQNILSFLLVLTMIFLAVNQADAAASIPAKDANLTVSVEAEESETEENDIIKKVVLRDKFKRSPETQITNFIKKYNRYSSSNNIEKLKDMYSDNYLNNDGFDKTTVFKMMEMSASSYKSIKYDTEILSIMTDGNYAVVKAHETAVGETEKMIEKVKDNGTIVSDIYYIDYLEKINNKWKITATEIMSEEVELKYGEAKKMKVDISAPACVPAGTEYEVTMKAKTPDGVFVVGSIVNEPIIYPQVQSKDVFRSIKSEEFTRILTSNKDNNNEYATISIALTRAMVEPPSVVLNMTGLGFFMKRVNVLSLNKNLNKEGADAAAENSKNAEKS